MQLGSGGQPRETLARSTATVIGGGRSVVEVGVVIEGLYYKRHGVLQMLAGHEVLLVSNMATCNGP